MELTKTNIIEELIFSIRGCQVMLDYHLAAIYAVETKRLNEQVKRNINRFPGKFMFQLTEPEWENLQSHIATTTMNQHLQSQFATAKRRTLPYVFTEQGVAMLSTVLNSDIAEDKSIVITKRPKNVSLVLYTKSINKTLQPDVEKHNAQYHPVEIKPFAESHDRFLILDGIQLYHLGASLKDLGKKWFAFSRMDSLAGQVLKQLKEVAI